MGRMLSTTPVFHWSTAECPLLYTGYIKRKAALSDDIAALMQTKQRLEESLEKENGDSGSNPKEMILKEVEVTLLQRRKQLLALLKRLCFKRELLHEEISRIPHLMGEKERKDFCKDIEELELMPLDNLQNITFLSVAEGGEASFQNILSCKSVSTYPTIGGKRAGDPICDYFCAWLLDNATLVALSDGCNWGIAPKEAAQRAANAFADYMKEWLPVFVKTNTVAYFILRAFAAAQHAILEGMEIENMWKTGTATLLGGVLLPLDTTISSNGHENSVVPKWTFIFGSVGDCKAFLWSHNTQNIIDLTESNRAEVIDARDCGGRLGPHLDGGKPDLRNLQICNTKCCDGDLIILVSDGVHDNFDPQHLGKLPRDLHEFVENGLHTSKDKDLNSWEELDVERVAKLKNRYRCKLLSNLLLRDGLREINLDQFTKRVIEHCVNITHNSRRFMEEHTGSSLPCDYSQFPGKMDHTTVAVIRVQKAAQMATARSLG